MCQGGRESPHRRGRASQAGLACTPTPRKTRSKRSVSTRPLAEAATKDADGMKKRALTLRLRAGGCARAPAGTLAGVRHVSRGDVGGQSLFLGKGLGQRRSRVVQKKHGKTTGFWISVEGEWRGVRGASVCRRVPRDLLLVVRRRGRGARAQKWLLSCAFLPFTLPRRRSRFFLR